MTREPPTNALTVAEIEAWLAQFPPDALAQADEGELVVVTGDAQHMLVQRLKTPA
jgi:hypothetical protein